MKQCQVEPGQAYRNGNKVRYVQKIDVILQPQPRVHWQRIEGNGPACGVCSLAAFAWWAKEQVVRQEGTG